MKQAVLALLACVLVSCASRDASRPHAGGDGDSPSREGTFVEIASTPLSDLNLVRPKIPPALLAARQSPYGLPGDMGCAGLMAEVRALDILLGADMDTPPDQDSPGLWARGAGFVGEAALDAARGAAEGLIPFRSWVRRLTGAERHSREVATAIAAGTVRRAYLKGLGRAAGCAPPASPRADARPAAWTEVARIAELFRQAGMEGTFVVCDAVERTCAGHDRARAEKRFVPASTFKIANSLIGLAVGAVDSVDEVLPYRGPARPFMPEWARDMGLREAIALSNVPIYQELARRIGWGRMGDYLERMEYGNAHIGGEVDRFWLDGPLKISALEQTWFMARLARATLPLPVAVQRAVGDILLQEQGEGWRLYAKTGWQNAPGPGVGWWVGWVEQAGRVHAFALNLDIKIAADAGRRQELGRASLKALGLL